MSLPTASVKTSAATSIVFVPIPDGVNVAVYTVALLAVKLDKDTQEYELLKNKIINVGENNK